MKKTLYFLLFITVLSISFPSCKNRESYAELLKAEKALIKDYIQRNNITVLNKFPEDSVSFPENSYVLTTSGLYYRLNKKGDEDGRNVQQNDEIIARYYEYTLDKNSVVHDYWNPQYYDDPFTFNYMSYTKASVAFHEAVGYMKKSGAEAELIVPHKIGFSAGKIVTPYGYKLRIQFRENSIEE